MWSFGLTQVLRSSGKTSGEGPETTDKAPKLMITGGAQASLRGRRGGCLLRNARE